MVIAILVIVGLSLLILGHEAGHFFVAKLFGLKVDEFGFGFPPRIFAWGEGETRYSLNWLPFGGFVRISGERGEFTATDGSADAPMSEADKNRLFFNQSMWKKSLIVLAGVATNFILGWFFISLVLMIGSPQTLIITGTEPNSPAAQSGFMSNDIVINYKDYQSFTSYVDSHEGQPIAIAVLRNGKEIDLTVTPRLNVAPGQGAIGVALEEGGTARENPFAAIRDGLLDAGIIFWLTLLAFGQLIQQIVVHASLPAGVVGPVGIFGVAEETGKIGLIYLLQLIGVISINLTIVNLIPFPALDGGRFVMILIEKMKGSAIPEKIEGWINGLGFTFLIVLMILITIRDVHGLF